MVSMTRRVGQADKTLKVGFVGSLLLGLLPQVIFEFRKLLPSVNIELVEMGTFEQIEALKSGKIDVGFGRLKFSDPAIARVLLRDESLVLAMVLAQKVFGIFPIFNWHLGWSHQAKACPSFHKTVEPSQ